ncbi:unnamed protein product, partial [Protopolystoma xenopodis]
MSGMLKLLRYRQLGKSAEDAPTECEAEIETDEQKFPTHQNLQRYRVTRSVLTEPVAMIITKWSQPDNMSRPHALFTLGLMFLVVCQAQRLPHFQPSQLPTSHSRTLFGRPPSPYGPRYHGLPEPVHSSAE